MFELEFHSPETAEELNVLLEQTKGQVVAGGTDVLPQLRRGQLRSTCLVDITRLKQLRFIRDVDGYIHIGALTTYAEVIASPLLQLAAPALVTAAATVGCPQTRYRGTLGGNLANASPAADSAPPLLSLEAKASLASIRGERSIPLQDFFSGPGKTNLAPTEYITSISFCRPAGRWGTAFYKLGKRNGMAISIVSAAAYLELDLDGLLQNVRLALGSVAPCPVRSPHAEKRLRGQMPSSELFRQAGLAALEDVVPIDDLRASAAYRRHATAIIVERVLQGAWQEAQRRSS